MLAVVLHPNSARQRVVELCETRRKAESARRRWRRHGPVRLEVLRPEREQDTVRAADGARSREALQRVFDAHTDLWLPQPPNSRPGGGGSSGLLQTVPDTFRRT